MDFTSEPVSRYVQGVEFWKPVVLRLAQSPMLDLCERGDDWPKCWNTNNAPQIPRCDATLPFARHKQLDKIRIQGLAAFDETPPRIALHSRPRHDDNDNDSKTGQCMSLYSHTMYIAIALLRSEARAQNVFEIFHNRFCKVSQLNSFSNLIINIRIQQLAQFHTLSDSSPRLGAGHLEIFNDKLLREFRNKYSLYESGYAT